MPDCAVFGIPDDEYGEAVHAAIQPQLGASLSEADVKTFLRGHLSGFEVPKTVAFQSDLPREDSGKIFKRKLREPFWANRSSRSQVVVPIAAAGHDKAGSETYREYAA